MDYRILGPLDVRVDGHALELGGEKPRALLAILLLHANEAVSVDRLIEGIWGEQLPPSAHKTLQGYIYRLRKLLENDSGEAGPAANGAVLVTSAHGYLLRVADGELDVDRFEALVEQGRQALALGDPVTAAELLRDALGLWRGPALADLGYEAFAQPASAQLEELRLAALEDRVDADLALGCDRDLVGELSALIEQNPLRERLRGQLMVALYRCGRQAEALEVYQRYRRALSQELGLDPSPALRELELSILSRDPKLDRAGARGSTPEPIAASARRLWSPARVNPRTWGLAVAAAMVVALAAAALVATSTGGGASPSVIAADAVGAISLARGTISAVVPVGSSPAAVAAGEGAVWVASYNDGTVSRIDPATHAVVQTIPAGSTPSALAVGAGAVWVTNNFSGTVSRIDPTVNRVVQTIPVGNGPTGVAVGGGSVWVTNSLDGTLSRIDAVTGAVVKTIALGGGASGVATGLGAVWVSDAADGRLLRIDPRTDQVIQPIDVGTGPEAIGVGYGSVWVANSLDGTVSRVDPQTNHVAATIPVGNGPSAIAMAPGGVWVASEFAGRVAHIAPATDTVAGAITVGNRPRGLAFVGGLLWVSLQASTAAHRGGTLTVLQNAEFGSLDPAGPGSLGSILTLYMTNDGLTAFKRVGGSDGAQLVPDLAISLPTPTDGGLTYTFQLRSGIRYSDGRPVRPEDFRRAIERDFKLGPGAPLQTFAYTYFEDLVGGAACLADPARCELSRGIVADDAARTVTFHLVRPDPELPAHLALWAAVAVPAGTPSHDIGAHPLAATGPYEIALDTQREIKLIRNPYFHEWSHAAQPDGYPDQIVWHLGGSIEAAVGAVERGTADYTIDPPPPDRLGEVQTRFAGQLHVNPTDEAIFIGLNTRARPFTDLRVRRALSYAIDRAELARLLGEDSHPICQMLPPYVPGHQPYCPYTLNPGAPGIWNAPDLRAAQTLIAASGTRGTPITIWNQPGFLTDFTAAARYLASLLDRLGYPTRIRTFSVNDTTFVPRLADSRTSPQAYLYLWAPNFPAPSEFLSPQFWSCQSFTPNSTSNANVGEFCDPRFDAAVRTALAAEATKSPTAAQLWAKADRQFTDQAPVINIATPSQTDLVSHRVGNYQYSPQQGVLIDQLWVR